MSPWKQLLSWLQSSTASHPHPITWTDPRPPDGIIETLPIPGLDGIPNSRDPRFLRFDPELSTLLLDPNPNSSTSTIRRQTPRLGGRVILMSLFVGRDGQEWTDDEIAQAHKALERAGIWLEAQAASWRMPLNIAIAQTYFQAIDAIEESVAISFVAEGEGFGPMEAHASFNNQASASRAAALLGFADFADLAGRLRPRVAADYWVWLLHPRRAGRSMAIPEPLATLPGVNLAVCYARETSFPEPLTTPPFTDPVTIVHEFLHLFGASDKYGLPLSHFPPREVTSRDVMLLHYQSLPRLQIDPLTAREIGWLNPGGS